MNSCCVSVRGRVWQNSLLWSEPKCPPRSDITFCTKARTNALISQVVRLDHFRSVFHC